MTRRKHATPHSLDVEGAQARIRGHHRNRNSGRTSQKTWKLSNANVADVASVLRLMTMFAQVTKMKENENGPIRLLVVTEIRFAAASGTSADVEALVRG